MVSREKEFVISCVPPSHCPETLGGRRPRVDLGGVKKRHLLVNEGAFNPFGVLPSGALSAAVAAVPPSPSVLVCAAQEE